VNHGSAIRKPVGTSLRAVFIDFRAEQQKQTLKTFSETLFLYVHKIATRCAKMVIC
jgi:hypothetical protein